MAVPALERCQGCDGRGPMGVRGPGPGIEYRDPHSPSRIVFSSLREHRGLKYTIRLREPPRTRVSRKHRIGTAWHIAHGKPAIRVEHSRAQAGLDDNVIIGSLQQPITIHCGRSSLHQFISRDQALALGIFFPSSLFNPN
jgi:hypothetical protein